MPSLFPCSPVVGECSWKKTQMEKKKLILFQKRTSLFHLRRDTSPGSLPKVLLRGPKRRDKGGVQ